VNSGREAKAGAWPVLPGWALKVLHLGGPSLVLSRHLLTDGLKMSCLYREYRKTKVFSPSYPHQGGVEQNDSKDNCLMNKLDFQKVLYG